MPKQSWVLTHAETITQNVVGLVIGYIILMCMIWAVIYALFTKKWFGGEKGE